MKKKLSITMILTTIAMALCSCTGTEPKAEVNACYRLTQKGADMANAALVERNAQKRLFKAWGIYPKGLDEDSTSTVEEYSAGDIIKTSSSLNLVINKSDIFGDISAMDDLFLIGTHNGGILSRKNADDSIDKIAAILYPSTTAVTGELSTYDLTANWVGTQTVDESLFNQSQDCAVNYKLVNNTGELSSNTYETNLHFAVTMKNDGGIITNGYSDVMTWSYEDSTESSFTSFTLKIANMFASYNSASSISVALYDLEGADFGYDQFKAAIEGAIADSSMKFDIKVKASDSDGNATDLMRISVSLVDEVKPYAIDSNGDVLETVELSIGEIDRCSDAVLASGVEKRLAKLGISFKDEVDGTVYPTVSMTNGTLVLTVSDRSGNSVEYVDSTSKFKNYGESSTIDCSGVPGTLNYGSSATSLEISGTIASDKWSYEVSKAYVNVGSDFEESVNIDILRNVSIYKTQAVNIILNPDNTLTVASYTFEMSTPTHINIFVGKNVALLKAAMNCSMNADQITSVYFECSEDEYTANVAASKYDEKWLSKGNNTINLSYGNTVDSFKTAVNY